MEQGLEMVRVVVELVAESMRSSRGRRSNIYFSDTVLHLRVRNNLHAPIQYIWCIHSIFGGAGKVISDEDLDVSRTEYDKGYTMYGFNLARDHDQVFEVSKRGSVRIYLKFDVVLAPTVNVIVYAKYENVIQIDSTRNVLLDYSN